MKAHYKLPDSVPKDYERPVYEGEAPLVHGRMTYQCKECGARFNMWLENKVEGSHKEQPCPFFISCHVCGSYASAMHINWQDDLHLPGLRPLMAGAHFFKFDDSGKERACGMPMVFMPRVD